MLATKRSVKSPEDATPIMKELLSSTLYMGGALFKNLDFDLDVYKRMVERDQDGLVQPLARYFLSKRFDGELEHYAQSALHAELHEWYTRDAREKEFHRLKGAIAEDDELPFRNLASADGQDETTTACTGPNPYNYPLLLPGPSAIRLVVLLPSQE